MRRVRRSCSASPRKLTTQPRTQILIPTQPQTPTPAPDIKPPSLQIISPDDGQRVRQRSRVQIELAATDDSGIRSVALRIDGNHVARFFGDGPYRYAWRVPAKSGRRVTVSARAEDNVGNFSNASVLVKVRRRTR